MAALALPGEAEAYLQDRFGLRRALIRAHGDSRPALGPGPGPVLFGRAGRMCYLGDDMVHQSAGLIPRDDLDLIKAFGANADAVAYHYIEYGSGHNENRTTTFDGLDYIAQYPDLMKAFGANERAGAVLISRPKHWL